MKTSLSFGYLVPFAPIVAILLLCSFTSVFGQSLPVSVSYAPNEYAAGDTVEMHLSIGTAENPASGVMTWTDTVYFPDFKISLASALGSHDQHATSWFAGDNYWNLSYQILENRYGLILTLQRTDQSTRSGHGYAASVTGIIISVDDWSRLKSSSTTFPEITRNLNTIRVRNTFSRQFMAQLNCVSGVSFDFEVQPHETHFIDLDVLARGCYWLAIRSPSGEVKVHRFIRY